MFPLHETTQRNLCRSAFIALGIAPLLAIVVYGTWLHLPSHRVAVASELTRRTGVTVSLDDLCYPRPGQSRLSDVRLCDPETGREIARIRELEIVESDGVIAIRAAQPQLAAEHFALVWRRLEERVLRAGPSGAKRIEVRAADLTITSPETESQTLRHVLLDIACDNQRTTAEFRYSVAGVDMPQPAVVRIVRERSQAGEGFRKLAWHTGGATLPVAPWAAKFSWLQPLGANCHFCGELTAAETASGWRGELAGTLTHIDLDQLISDQFPHKLSGEAQVKLEELRFADGRVELVCGQIIAGPGVIGQSLVASAMEHAALQLADKRAELPKPDALRRYARLGLQFSLNQQALKLSGACAAAPPQTALVLGNEHYRTAQESSLSPLALVRVLSPASDHQVPATSSTRGLVLVLPLPREAAHAEDALRGHVRSQ